jgi:hypothetical protein
MAAERPVANSDLCLDRREVPDTTLWERIEAWKVGVMTSTGIDQRMRGVD